MTTAQTETTTPWSAAHPAALAPILVASRAEGSVGPLALARWLAVREGRPLHIVTALAPTGPVDFPVPDGALAQIYDDGASSVSDQIEEMVRCTPFKQLHARTEVVFGPMAPMIARTARQQSAALIVVGSGRSHGAGRARSIVRISEVPVLLVPPGVEPGPLSRAVVAVDFSSASLRAARAVLPLLADDGHITLVHVKSAYHLNESDVATFDEDYATRAEHLFGTFTRALDLPAGVTLSTALLHGATAPQIVDFISRDNADILACGRRNRSALRNFFLGTVSAELMQRVHIATLIVPETAAVEPDIETEFSGVERWPSGGWSTLLTTCAERHRGELVHLELIAEATGDPCLVARDYELLDIVFEPDGSHMAVMLRDPHATNGQASIWIPGVRALTLESSLAGADRHLAFECERGHGALRFAAS